MSVCLLGYYLFLLGEYLALHGSSSRIGLKKGEGIYAAGLRVSTVVADADAVLISAASMWLRFYS